MYQIVRDNLMAFQVPMEGKVRWMYADSLGLVSIGVGNLIDPISLAYTLPSLGAPYLNKNTQQPGTDAEIDADWNQIKSTGAGWKAAEDMTTLQITEEGCQQLVLNKADELELYFTNHAEDPAAHTKAFSNYANWPADAQLALMSMTWAMGAAFADGGKWPNFRAACTAESWLDAAANCRMVNAWLIRRNAVNRGLFRNAAWAIEQPNYDPSALLLPVGVARPDLHHGDDDSGGTSYVSDAQRTLNWLGYTISETGTFDDDTLTQVKAFQQAEGFPTTGTIGPLTWAALGYVVPKN